MKTLDVGAAVILRKKNILITQRDLKRFLGGKWEFPGGKIEDNESVKEGLAREILEELGIEVDVGELLTVVPHEYEGVVSIKLHTYFCKPKHIKFKISEHENIAWVGPKDLLNYDLAPADLKAANILLEKG
jgi:8-oxo-dGTP diphosphatase